MSQTTAWAVTNPTTIEQALGNEEVNAAVARGIFKITKLRKPSRSGGRATRDGMDWQDIFSKVAVKLSDPAVGFAAANFSPAFAFGVAKNTGATWLRERMKERPRRSRKPVAEQEAETVAFQTVQFDSQFEPKQPQDPQRLPNTKGILALEEILDHSDYQFAKGVLESFAVECPEDHEWLMEYMTTRRLRKHTNADHQRAARLCRKLRQVFDEQWDWEPGQDEEFEELGTD